MKQLFFIILCIVSVTSFASHCSLTSGDCPQVSRPDAETQMHDSKAFASQMLSIAHSNSSVNPSYDLYPQVMAKIEKGDPVQDLVQLGLISAPAARFCFWVASRAKNKQYYDFYLNNPFIISRDRAVFGRGFGRCDCYHLSEARIKQAQQYAQAFLTVINQLAAAPVQPDNPKLGFYENLDNQLHYMAKQDKKMAMAINLIKTDQPGQICQQWLNQYMQQLGHCAVPVKNAQSTGCPSYQTVYGYLWEDE